jgi:hypothetical protein
MVLRGQAQSKQCNLLQQNWYTRWFVTGKQTISTWQVLLGSKQTQQKPA